MGNFYQGPQMWRDKTTIKLLVPLTVPQKSKNPISGLEMGFSVATVGIEPTTPAFSVLCSTN
jgi:hypothetical protein